jgi:crossover junction endodeoxyribonuclease RusA
VTPGRSWRLDLPWSTPPLTLNPRQHGHHMARARVVKRVRLTSRQLAEAAGIPALSRIAVEVHYRPRDRRRRDALNLVPITKAVEDGLVDAAVVPDDTGEYVQPTMPQLDPVEPGRPSELYVLVHELIDDPRSGGQASVLVRRLAELDEP